jgi:uncharacterized membrane protein YhaH (DUF805 family)
MQEIILRFLRLEAINDHPVIYIGLAVCWATLVIVTLFSIRAQRLSGAAMAVWTAVVILIPVAGLFCYLILCLFAADWSFASFAMNKPKSRHTKLHERSEPQA